LAQIKESGGQMGTSFVLTVEAIARSPMPGEGARTERVEEGTMRNPASR
jgi:hypothetical protein